MPECRISSLFWVAATLVQAVLLLGCASSGMPRPPSLRLPDPVKDLHAERVGSDVLLSFTVPPRTTDGDLIRGPVVAQVCRAVGTLAETACVPSIRVAVAPGKAAATDPLPGALTQGKGPLLVYRVALLNAAGRTEGLSKPVLAAAGLAPQQPERVQAQGSRDGVVLSWQPANAGEMRIHRTALNAPRPATAAEKKPAPGMQLPLAKKADAADVDLTVPQAGGSDPGGVVDRTARDQMTYRYVAQRVQPVTLDGHALELRSAASAPVTLAYADTFAPAAPAGLVLVPGGGFGSPASIDLSWDANVDADLLGYNVYRAEADGAFARLTPEPVTAPAYHDAQVAPDRRYRYSVTAVDKHHNESAPSPSAAENLHP